MCYESNNLYLTHRRKQNQHTKHNKLCELYRYEKEEKKMC